MWQEAHHPPTSRTYTLLHLICVSAHMWVLPCCTHQAVLTQDSYSPPTGYPEQVHELLEISGTWKEQPCLESEACREGHHRPSTHYAREAAAAGREIHDLCYVHTPPGDN